MLRLRTLLLAVNEVLLTVGARLLAINKFLLAVSACFLAVGTRLLTISALGHRLEFLRHRLHRASQLSQLLGDTRNVLGGRHVSPDSTPTSRDTARALRKSFATELLAV